VNLSLNWLHNPASRRKILAISSGSLILLALAAGRLPGLPSIGNLFMIAATLIAGADIAVRAWNSLMNRHISIELLVTVAAAGALAIGEYWEAAAVTFLFIFGAYLEARTLSRTRQVLGELLDLAPPMAIVWQDGFQQEVPAGEVQEGQVVLVKPGSKIPVDGEVIEGRSAVDESAITGEPFPEEKSLGSLVFAGTVNQNGFMKVRTTGAGAETTLARIIQRVEEAQEEKAPTQRFIERFARWYTPFIIVLSGSVFLLTRDIELALTLLVIGCPGALVISTPVSVVAGIGRAAKGGILIKGGEYLENAGKISALALDKTGTLTQGRPVVTHVIPFDRPAPALKEPVLASVYASADHDKSESGGWEARPAVRVPAEEDVLRWASIAEAGSEHPLARAIMAEGENLFPEGIPSADRFNVFTGRGVRAIYSGHEIGVGTLELMEEMGVKTGPEEIGTLKRLAAAGETAVLVAVDGFLAGALGISDPVREAAPGVIERFNEIGLERVIMLTGDDRETALAIADKIGISEVRADLLPEDKLDVIRNLQADGHIVAMAGDGINDAPALAAADIGIAMGAAGTDVAIETADIALMADDLLKIPEAIHLSKATLRNIRTNVSIALITVAALLLGVLFGKVHMAGGMLVHEASVLVVILNGMRLLRA
jgi:Cd2+/Zn2+-exporting ATPase